MPQEVGLGHGLAVGVLELEGGEPAHGPKCIVG
jgi:hypothetical protein